MNDDSEIGEFRVARGGPFYEPILNGLIPPVVFLPCRRRAGGACGR